MAFLDFQINVKAKIEKVESFLKRESISYEHDFLLDNVIIITTDSEDKLLEIKELIEIKKINKATNFQ